MEDHPPPPPPRPPLQADLVELCRALNAEGVRYIVVGGFAVIHHGFLRATEDIDLLVDDAPDNQARLKRALEVLPDKAIRELGEDDLRNYNVVRVADDIMVDLMRFACGIDYREAAGDAITVPVSGVPVPFASAQLLLRMKQTHREKDELDRQFLERKVREESN